VSGFAPELLLAAHGSSDPRFAEVVRSIAHEVRERRPSLDVSVGYLDHDRPLLREIATPGSIVIPLLLTTGYHVTVDIPGQATDCLVTAPIGPHPALLPVLVRRLRQAGWIDAPVVLAAAGSTSPTALDQVRGVGRTLSATLGVEVTTAFVSAGSPRLADLGPVPAIASFVLAPGYFHDTLDAVDCPVVSAPLGAAPELVDIALARYDTALSDAETGEFGAIPSFTSTLSSRRGRRVDRGTTGEMSATCTADVKTVTL
jgi:sirohydrochlorin ferrochelatase